jgi:hypothetical protein
LGKKLANAILTGENFKMYFDETTIKFVLCGLCLLSRLSDIATTRLGAPKLVVESNLLAKKLGWKFIFLTVLAGLLPLYSVNLGMAITIVSFLAAFSNAAKLLVYRQLGEETVNAMIVSSVKLRGAFTTWLIVIGPSVISIFIGITLFIAAGRYPNEVIRGAVLGFFIFPAAIFLHAALTVAGIRKSLAI